MFSKPKDSNTSQAQSSASARRPMRTAPSIISSDLSVRGNLVATGDVQIDGNVEGDVRSNSLTIGESATISGDIYAEDVTIRGRIKGTVRAKRVQLAETSHVEGDIIHESLAVETGAYFDGMCRHSDNPLADTNNGKAMMARRDDPAAKMAPGAAANEGGAVAGMAPRTGGLFGNKADAKAKEGVLISARS